MNNIINIHLSNQITLTKTEIPLHLLAKIKTDLTLDNPIYLEAEKRGYYTGHFDKNIFCYQEGAVYLYINRGYLDPLLLFLYSNGLKCKIIDCRLRFPEIDFIFRGKLREYQKKATMTTTVKHFGAMVAPCGSGKTVMALSIIAQRKQPTLIIVHTKELLNQWIDRIVQYLDIPKNEIGIIGAGKAIIKPITVGMAQTLCKRNLNEISQHFGFLIVDECHHTPSNTFTKIVSAFDCYYMLGLSATPYRRDRLDKLINISIGNVVAEVKESDLQKIGIRIKPEIIIRKTEFDYSYNKDSDYQPMISALTKDEDRNKLIIDDVRSEIIDHNYCLILSDRKTHCKTLAAMLYTCAEIKIAILNGDTPKKERESIIKQLKNNKLRVVFATGQLAGEGLDIPKLNRLFVVTPIRWRGRVKQYVGRILRPAEGKIDAKIYDYVDNVNILKNMYRSRYRQVYNQLRNIQ